MFSNADLQKQQELLYSNSYSGIDIFVYAVVSPTALIKYYADRFSKRTSDEEEAKINEIMEGMGGKIYGGKSMRGSPSHNDIITDSLNTKTNEKILRSVDGYTADMIQTFMQTYDYYLSIPNTDPYLSQYPAGMDPINITADDGSPSSSVTVSDGELIYNPFHLNRRMSQLYIRWLNENSEYRHNRRNQSYTAPENINPITPNIPIKSSSVGRTASSYTGTEPKVSYVENSTPSSAMRGSASKETIPATAMDNDYGIDKVEYLTGKSQLNSLVKPLAELHTMSISAYRDKEIVKSLGRVTPNGFTRGFVTFAGTMIFTVLHQGILNELFTRSFLDDKFNGNRPDQLPPLDLFIVYHNELGYRSKQALFGVEFFNEGQTMSVQDLLLENSITYMARHSTRMKRIDRNASFIDDEDISLLMDIHPTFGIVGSTYKEAQNDIQNMKTYFL